MPATRFALTALLLLTGCSTLNDINPFADDDNKPPMAMEPLPADLGADNPALVTMAPEQIVETAPLAPPPPLVDASLPMAEMWAAERVAERFITLHRLAVEGLIEPDLYDRWVQRNEGALLVMSAPPPVKGLAAKIPPYDQLADYLSHIKKDREDIAAAERAALLGTLMPSDGPRAAAMRPPKPEDMPRWTALLDRVAAEGALPRYKVAGEKAVLKLLR